MVRLFPFLILIFLFTHVSGQKVTVPNEKQLEVLSFINTTFEKRPIKRLNKITEVDSSRRYLINFMRHTDSSAIWIALRSDFKKNNPTELTYYFYANDTLFAIVYWPHKKGCKKCKNTYVIENNEIVFGQELIEIYHKDIVSFGILYSQKASLVFATK